MIKLFAITAAVALTVGLLGVPQAVAQVPDVPGWRLQWHDEFDGPQIDEQNWQRIDLKNSFNNEKQYYRPEQASIAGGKLRITATNEPLDGKPYRSARLESVSQFGPGRFEARIDLPTTQGMWPAFWLLPNGTQWPTGGEIDILENRGRQPLVISSAYHWQTDPGPCCSQHRFVFEEYSSTANGAPVNFHDGFHVYAVEWETTQLRFYIDGVLHYTVNQTPSRPIFENPMNIILNLAVGGDFGGDPDGTTVFPQHMEIDYVRVWQPKEGLSGDYNGDQRVDATDYVAWRNSLGQSGIGLPADGSGNGMIDNADYFVWRSNFGAFADMTSAVAAEVPEPTGAALAALGLLRAMRRPVARLQSSRRYGLRPTAFLTSRWDTSKSYGTSVRCSMLPAQNELRSSTSAIALVRN
jgi:beta-glucanase (GH16 family)